MNLSVQANVNVKFSLKFRIGNFVNRGRRLLHVINLGIKGVSGVAFGGPKGDTLYVTVAENTVDTETGELIPTGEGGSSLYQITGLCVIGQTTPSVQMNSNLCSI